jgi:Protein of unknown function (DUF3040)
MASDGGLKVPLNENEERILQEIEQRFLAHDPESAKRLRSTTLPKYLARNCKWAALGFLVGLAVLLLGFASSWVVGVFGFAVMLGSAIVLTHNVRRMGQHGLRQLTESLRGRNLNEAIDDATRRLRRRFGGDDS